MINRLRELWEGLGRNNQIVLVVSSLGVLVALVGFIAWASTPEYVPLFSNLSAQDANAISDKLREANVPFRLEQGGTALSVPAQSRDEMRMKIMSQGLPQTASASLGYELLDKGGNIGDTQPMEEMRLLRIKEGEIGKSIMSLQQVSSATVHVAPADSSPFVTDKHDASASVFVNIRPGGSLSEENVRSVVRLTQMSYTGLEDKNISVVDQQGNLLWDGKRSGDGSLTDDRIKAQDQLARAKRTEYQALLDNTIGPRKAVVIVNVELNSDKEEIKTNTVEPGAVTTQSTTEEKLNGAGQVKGGAGGTNANLGGAPNNAPLAGGAAPGVPSYVATNDASGTYTNTSTTKVSEPSRTEKITQKSPGRIEKLTVSALVDTKVKPEQVASIEKTLKTAIGAAPNDPTRLVNVSQIEFDRSKEVEERSVEDAQRRADSMAHLFAVAVPLGIMLLTFLLLARALRKPAQEFAGGQLALPGGGSIAYTSDGTALTLGADGMPLPGQSLGSSYDEEVGALGLSGASTPHTYEVIEEAFDANLESILHLTRSKPETVAALIRGWISKEE